VNEKEPGALTRDFDRQTDSVARRQHHDPMVA
jgi:hypothetical protein